MSGTFCPAALARNRKRNAKEVSECRLPIAPPAFALNGQISLIVLLPLNPTQLKLSEFTSPNSRNANPQEHNSWEAALLSVVELICFRLTRSARFHFITSVLPYPKAYDEP